MKNFALSVTITIVVLVFLASSSLYLGTQEEKQLLLEKFWESFFSRSFTFIIGGLVGFLPVVILYVFASNFTPKKKDIIRFIGYGISFIIISSLLGCILFFT